MKKSLIILGFVVAVVLAVVFVFTQTATTPTPASLTNSAQKTTDTDDNSVLQPSTSNETSPAAKVTIVVTDNGFSPSSVIAKMGDTIMIKNETNRSVQFASDPHPSHTKNSELNQSTISAGASQTFTVTQKGTFGFHDHNDARLTGVITVE